MTLGIAGIAATTDRQAVARRPEPTRRASFVILGLLVSLFVLVGLMQAARDAPTVDEAVDLSAGLVAVQHRDLRMNPEHGLLHRVVPAILPIAIADPLVPRTAAFDRGDWFDYTDDLIMANDAEDRLDAVVFWYRVLPLLAGAGTGVLLYVLGARLLGRLAGLVCAGLWLTTPYVVGLSHLSSLDVSFACALVGLAIVVDRHRSRPTMTRAAVLAAVFGLALLVRHSAAVLAPLVIGVVVATWWQRPRRERLLTTTAIVALLPLVVVWVAHRIVDPTPVGGEPRDRFDGLVATASAAGPLEAAALAVPMPIEWRAGFAYLAVTSEDRPAYLLGDRWEGSRPWFFPVSALVKLPLTATLALLAGAVGWMRADAAQQRRAVLSAGAVAALYGAFVVLQPLNLGLRLIVPTLALVMLLSAGIVRFQRRTVLVALVVAGCGQAVTFAAAHPASLAWTPPPFADGYRFVSDSSIDFGQANRSVRYDHGREPFDAASLLAPRGYDVLRGVPPVHVLGSEELVGRFAVSATALDVLRAEELAWLRSYCPVDVIDGAVLVYRFEHPPDRSRPSAMPAAPCLDATFSWRP